MISYNQCLGDLKLCSLSKGRGEAEIRDASVHAQG